MTVPDKSSVLRARRVKGARVGYAVVAITAGLLVAFAALVSRYATPPGERLVQTIFEEGLISFHFEDTVRRIARNYVRDTLYSGRVAVNLPPRPKHLNVYVFYHREPLPGTLKNNCTSFPDESIILCDHALLDSVPVQAPLVLDEGDPVYAPFLLNWMIGHEIGHVVLGHRRSRFLGYGPIQRDGKPIESEGQTLTLASVDIVGDEYERQADKFAMERLELGPSAVVQYGPQLLDAILYELPKTEILYVDDESHPPFLIRALRFFTYLKDAYVEFVLPPMWRDKDLEGITIRSGRVPDPPLFGGFYIGSDDDAGVRLEKTIDRAAALFASGDHAHARALLRVAATDAQANGSLLSEPLSSIVEILNAVLNESERSPQAEFLFATRCAELPPESRGRCLGLLFLAATQCYAKASTEPLWPSCPSLEEFQRVTRTYDEQQIQFSGGRDLMSWLLPLEYEFRARDGAVDEETGEARIDGFVLRAAEMLVGRDLGELARDLIIRHVAGLVEQGDAVSTMRLLGNLDLLLQVLALNNDELAVAAVGLEMIEIVDDSVPRPHGAHALERTRVARVLWRFGAFEQAHGLFEEALAARVDVLTEARREDLPEPSGLRQQVLIAKNDVLHSFLMQRRCDEGLPLAAELRDEIQDAGDDEGLRALTLENIAATHVGAVGGSPTEAVSAALESLAIRERLFEATHDRVIQNLWTVASAHFRADESEEAAAAGQRYVAAMESKTLRRVETASIYAPIAGELVSLARILGVAPVDRGDRGDLENQEDRENQETR